MLGTRTTKAVTAAATSVDELVADLATLREDVRDTLSEVKTAAQRASVAFEVLGVVAFVGLLLLLGTALRMDP